MATTLNSRQTTYYPESGSYKQDEMNDLQSKVIRFIGDYYPDKMAVVGMRTYFKRSPQESRMEIISMIVFRVQRVRERWVNYSAGVPSIVVKATFNRDHSVTLKMEV